MSIRWSQDHFFVKSTTIVGNGKDDAVLLTLPFNDDVLRLAMTNGVGHEFSDYPKNRMGGVIGKLITRDVKVVNGRGQGGKWEKIGRSAD